MYDLHRLRLLRELSHRGTLAAVAEALGYSPSAVSHQLSILEREVNARLLEPAGRGVRLTPTAATLVAHTETILRELERAEASVAASRTEITGTVRVATFQTAAHTLVLDAPVPTAWPARSLADLDEAPWVMEQRGTAARAWSESVCRAAGFEPRVRYETSDLGLHAQIVARGRGVALLPRLGHTPSPAIRLIPTGDTRAITASTRRGSEDTPATKALRDVLVTP